MTRFVVAFVRWLRRDDSDRWNGAHALPDHRTRVERGIESLLRTTNTETPS